jgi:uncharacterized FlgJ-related protein
MKKAVLFLATLSIATTISTFAFWAKSYELEIENKELHAKNDSLALDLLFNKTDMSLTKKNVDAYIDCLPFSDKVQAKKQYRYESGHLTSELARKDQNIYGMKTSSRKHTYSYIANKYKYVGYEHWTLSVVDRLLYDIYVGKLRKNYSTDTNYLTKLK